MALRVFGLTGGIGSGKSAVAKRFRARGLAVVDADDLARRAVIPGSAGLAKIVEYFGADVLSEAGTLDRARLGQRVFSDPEQRRALDAIVHPVVRELARAEFAGIEAQGAALACYEVPLLYEVGLDAVYRPVVVVDAPLAARKARIAARDGLGEAQVLARVLAQMPLEDKVRRADYVLDNSGGLTELDTQSDALLDRVCDELGLARFS